MNWLHVERQFGPLILSFPHAGTQIPEKIESRLASPWLSRKDTDWHIEKLYEIFAYKDYQYQVTYEDLLEAARKSEISDGIAATIIRTDISRTVIDVNRDPSGASLYPGQTTTELCPTTTFDGEPLYRTGEEPTLAEIAERRKKYFDPYHAALDAEIARLKKMYPRIVVFDCHSIRSIIPRLFDGTLPNFNIGTNNGRSCDLRLTELIEATISHNNRLYEWTLTQITDGRFKGGWITRRLGDPANGVHAVQMELAMRGYLNEPIGPVDEFNWPRIYDETYAKPLQSTLGLILHACLQFAKEKNR